MQLGFPPPRAFHGQEAERGNRAAGDSSAFGGLPLDLVFNAIGYPDTAPLSSGGLTWGALVDHF